MHESCKELNPVAGEKFFGYIFHYESGLREAVLNLIEHGRGGTLEVYRFQQRGQRYPGLMFKLIDQDGPGVKDPNELLRKSREAHLSSIFWGREDPSEKRGYGFWNIVNHSDAVTIDSLGIRWGLMKESPQDFHFEPMEKSDVSKGTVLTMTLGVGKLMPSGGSNPWKNNSPTQKSIGTPPAAGLEESVIDADIRNKLADLWAAWNPAKALSEQPPAFAEARDSLGKAGFQMMHIRSLPPEDNSLFIRVSVLEGSDQELAERLRGPILYRLSLGLESWRST